MAVLRILAIVVVALTVKDGVLSCSLKNHKSGTSPCSSPTSDSTTDNSVLPPYHHHPGTKPHKKPSICDSSATSSSSSTNAIPSLPTDLPSKPTLNLPGLASNYIQSSPTVNSAYNLALLNDLIKLLTHSGGVNRPFSQLPFDKQPLLPNSPLFNHPQVPVPNAKPNNIIFKPNGVTLPGSVSSSVPCAENPSSTLSQDPSQQVAPILSPPITFFQTDSLKPNLINTKQTFPLVFPESTGLIGSKPTHISPCSTITPTSDKNTANTELLGSKITPIPPFTLFTPTFDKNSIRVPFVSKPLNVAHYPYPCVPPGSNFGLSNGSPGFPNDSSLSSKNTTPKDVSSSTLKTDLKKTPTSSTSPPVPETTSKPTSGVTSPQTPEEFPASVPSTLYGHNQAILNQILKMLQSSKSSTPKSTTLTPYLQTTSTPFISKPNASLTASQVQTPALSASPICLTLNPSSCLPSNSVLPVLSTSDLVTPPSAPLLFPTFTSGVPYGYNPAFMKLLVKQLLSNLASSPQTLPSSFPLPQSILKPTPVPFPISNLFSKPTNNGQPSDFNSNVMSNKFPDNKISTPLQVPTTTSKIPLFNNSVNFTKNFYNTLFASSTPSIIPSTPFLPSSSPRLSFNSNAYSESTTAPNKFNPCKSTSDSVPNLLNKLTNLTPGSSLPFSGLFPITVTPFPFPNSNLEPVKNIIPETIPQPTETPSPCILPQLSGPILCRLKHLRLHSTHGSPLSHSPHVSHPPHSQHLSHPLHSSHLPHLPHSPHSLHSQHSSLGCP